jgi:hypothetical protein
MAPSSGLKDRQRQILALVQSKGSARRRQISQTLGLPLPTVIRLVAELLDGRYLYELNSEARATPGRPNTPVMINGSCAYAIGVEISDRKWSWAVADAALNEVASGGPFKAEGALSARGVRVIIAALRQEMHKNRIPWNGIESIVFAAHAIVAASGDIFIDYSDHEPAMNLNSVAGAESGKHCVSNDPARLICEIEHAQIDGTDAAYLLYGDRGHGMGIVALGRILQSSNGICGEIGHLAIASTKRSLGPQTLVQATNGNIIVKQCEAEAWGRELPRSDGGKLALADICRAAKRGHVGANELLCEHARIVGTALASVVSLIGCETIVIGGVWEDSGEEVRSCFELEIRKHIAGAIAERIQVRYATHGTERTAFAAALHGARQVWARLS